MLIVEAHYNCKPGTRPELLKILSSAVINARAEDGNISYEQYPDRDNEDGVFVLEKWVDEASFDKHGKAEQYKAFCARRKPLLVPDSFRITVYNAEENSEITSRLRGVPSGNNNK